MSVNISILKRVFRKRFFSLLTYLRLYFSTRDLIKIKVKEYPFTFKIRNTPVDKSVLNYVFFQKYHSSSLDLTRFKRPVILDLGANIGLTALDYSHQYKDAFIYSYEMDIDNYNLCVENCSVCSNIFVFNNAIWDKNTSVRYSRASNSDSYNVSLDSNINEDFEEVEAVTVSQIIENQELDIIHFLKMDIEGAELQILDSSKELKWLDRIISFNIEVHNGVSLSPFIDILESKGFVVWKDSKHWSCIKGIKKSYM